MDTATDEGLLAASAQGDQFAFGLLVGRHRSYLITVADSILHNLTDAEDLVQDVLAEVWRKLDRFDAKKATVKTWLVTITRNRAIDRMRKLATYHRTMERAAALIAGETAAPITGEANELAARIEQYAEFTPMQMEAWSCTYILGMGNNEAARFLGIPESTYRMRLKLCRENVARVLPGLVQPGAEITPKKKAGRPPKAKPEPKGPFVSPPRPIASYLSSRGYWVARVRENGKARYVGIAKTRTEALSKAIDAIPQLSTTV